jgi:hypothetical protein
MNADDPSVTREVIGGGLQASAPYASVWIPWRMAFTAASSFRAAPMASVRTNFEAFAGPAAL